MPKKGGNWKPPNARETGTGKWTFKDVKSVQFNDGYLDFGAYTYGGKDNKFHIVCLTAARKAGAAIQCVAATQAREPVLRFCRPACWQPGYLYPEIGLL